MCGGLRVACRISDGALMDLQDTHALVTEVARALGWRSLGRCARPV